MKTKVYVNEYALGEFNDCKIQESYLILRNCPMQNYKLLSWLQSDPTIVHEIDIDVEDSFGKNEYVVYGGHIKGFDVDQQNIKKVVIGFNNIVRLNDN